MANSERFVGSMRFVVKHAVAGALLVVGAVVLSAALYFGLLAFAIIMNEGVGGPLALPGMMLFALIAGVLIAAVFAVVTALAEWICYQRSLSIWHQIPISTGLFGIVCLLFWHLSNYSDANTALVAALIFALLLLPLGAYWWTLRSADWLLRAGARLIAKIV